MSMEIRIKQNSVMTILPIHFRFGPMYTYFNDVLPERRVTATLVVCVKASILTRQLLPSYILIIFLFQIFGPVLVCRLRDRLLQFPRFDPKWEKCPTSMYSWFNVEWGGTREPRWRGQQKPLWYSLPRQRICKYM